MSNFKVDAQPCSTELRTKLHCVLLALPTQHLSGENYLQQVFKIWF